jgi:glycosyltransferase involved in cell wall biosynthesis
LQREFDVDLVAFSRRNHQPDEAARAAAADKLRRSVSHVADPAIIPSEWSLARKLLNHVSSLVTGKPYIFYDYFHEDLARGLGEALSGSPPDLVHMDSMDLYRWLPSVPALPVACTHHNVESQLLRQRGDRIGRPLTGAYLKHQAKLVEKVERRLSPRFALNVMTSERDAVHLRALSPGARTTVVPNGVDVEYFRPTSSQGLVPGRVVFLGPTYMFPNRDAVDFFLTDVWPSVRSRVPGSTLHLIGKNSIDEKRRFEAYNGVRCEGYVPDIRPSFAQAECSIVPLRVGGGTRLKILDAWSMGKAIVSTSIGCEGLETTDGRNIVIRDDAKGFADAVVEVLNNSELRNRLAREGRATVERHYAWPIVGDHLNSVYSEFTEGAAPRSTFR